MCFNIKVSLPTVETFLLLYSLKNGCKIILIWTLFRTLFCFLFFLTTILELFVRRSFPFGYLLINTDVNTNKTLVDEDNFYFVYVSYFALLIGQACLCVHGLYLCAGLFHDKARLFEPYLTCRFTIWVVEVVFLFILCITHKLLIGWYLGMLFFIILEFYSFIVVYSHYVALLDCEREASGKERLEPCELCT